MTGKAGTGKTTLLKAFLRQLDPDTAVAYVFNSTLSFDDILEYVLEDLGIGTQDESRAQRLMVLDNFLRERERAGQCTVLIIDEAQHLDPPTLRRVGMLSNLSSEASKLMQILLVGQPELDIKLDLPELRELRQRIGLRCHLAPLSRREAHEYVRDRLSIAGAPDSALFDEAAIARIVKHSAGIPRAINILADHCLLFAYTDEKRRIGRRIVSEAIDYLEESARTAGDGFIGRRVGPLRGWRWATAAVGFGVACAIAGFVLAVDPTVHRVLLALKDLLTLP